MDGRRSKLLTRWLALGSLAILGNSVGCKWFQKSEPVTPGIPGQVNAGKDIFGRPRGFVPTAPKEQPMVAAVKKGKKPISAETEIAFAEPEVEAAMEENRTPTERDALLDEARQRYNKALKADPKNKAALLGMAKVYTLSNNKDKAVEYYREAMKHSPKDHEIVFRAARMYMHFEDWPNAIEMASTAQKMDPENLRYPKAIAYFTARSGNFQKAYDHLLTCRMTEADARFFLGRLLLDLDRVEEGQQQMVLALKANPNHASARDVLAVIQERSATQQAGFQQK